MMQEQDPFAEFRLNQTKSKSGSSQSFSQSDSTMDENDPLSEFRIKKIEGFPFLRETGRHLSRTASRFGETILGMPGDVSSLIQSGVFAGLENLVGHKADQETREKAKSTRPATSKELKNISETLTEGFTSPQNDIEKSIDEYTETAASLLGPMKFRKALGVALGSQFSKEGAKVLGLGEGSQEASKLGTMFLLSTINPKGAMKFAANQYEVADKLSKGASIQAKNLESNLKSLQKDLQKGVTTSAKNVVVKPVDELLNKIQNGKIGVQDLTTAKRDINTLMGDPVLLKRERNLLKTVAGYVDKAIKPYEKINPGFSKAYRPANEIYGAIQQGNKAHKFISNILGTKNVLAATLGEMALGHPEYMLPTAAGAGLALGASRSVDFFTRLSKSPELRKYYGKALLAASKEDVGALRMYADKIEKIMEND